MKMRKSTHLWREEDHPRDDWGRFCKSNRLYDDMPIDKMHKISIIIDEQTPCLRRTSDGAIIKTSFVQLSPKKGDFSDWLFDWSKEEMNGFSVLGLKADGDDRIQGLIAYKPDWRSEAIKISLVESAPFNNSYNNKSKAKEYIGVGPHLFAEAVKKSYELGFDGYVYFVAKTALIEHYEKTLCAKLINEKHRIMVIEERSAKELYERYYQNNSD